MSRMSASFNKSMSKQKSLDTSWFSNIGNEQKTIHYLCVRFTVCLIIGFGWNSARSLRYIKIWYICMRCHFNLPCFDLATMMFLLNHTELYRHGNLYNNSWRNRNDLYGYFYNLEKHILQNLLLTFYISPSSMMRMV